MNDANTVFPAPGIPWSHRKGFEPSTQPWYSGDLVNHLPVWGSCNSQALLWLGEGSVEMSHLRIDSRSRSEFTKWSALISAALTCSVTAQSITEMLHIIFNGF